MNSIQKLFVLATNIIFIINPAFGNDNDRENNYNVYVCKNKKIHSQLKSEMNDEVDNQSTSSSMCSFNNWSIVLILIGI